MLDEMRAQCCPIQRRFCFGSVPDNWDGRFWSIGHLAQDARIKETHRLKRSSDDEWVPRLLANRFQVSVARY
jgi:hypothetical protein